MNPIDLPGLDDSPNHQSLRIDTRSSYLTKLKLFLDSLPGRLSAKVIAVGVLLLAIPAVWPLFSFQPFVTDDGHFHLERLFEFDRALRTGAMYPRWSSDLYFGYGYPIFNFYPPLAYYLSELAHLLGLDFISAQQVAFILAVFLAACGMFLLARDLFEPAVMTHLHRDLAALFSAAIYCYSGYLLLDVYIRGAVAETLAMAFLPYVLWSLRRLVHYPAVQYIALAGIFSALLVLSHNLTASFTAPLLACFLSLESVFMPGWRARISASFRLIAAALIALALSAVYWLPAVAELPLVYIGLPAMARPAFEESLLVHLIPASLLIQTSWLYSYRVDPWPVSPPLPLFTLATAALGFVAALLWLRGKVLLTALFWAALALTFSLGMTFWAKSVWLALPWAMVIQFAWRLTLFITAGFAILGGLLILAAARVFKRMPAVPIAVTAVLVVGTMFSGMGQLHPEPWFTSANELSAGAIARSEVNERIPGAGFFAPPYAEYLPVSVTGVPFPQLGLRKVAGTQTTDAQVPLFHLETASAIRWTLSVDAPAAMTLPFRLFYYPDWKGELDGSPIQPFPSTVNGLLSVNIPAGQHYLDLIHDTMTDRAIAGFLSVAGFLVLLALVVIGLRGALRPLAIGMAASAFFVLLTSLLLARTAFAGSLPIRPVQLDLDSSLRLIGYQVESGSDILQLRLVWQVKRQVQRELPLKIELVDSGGAIRASRTAYSRYGTGWMVNWQPNEVADDTYVLPLDPALSVGSYAIRISRDPNVGPITAGPFILDNVGTAPPASFSLAPVDVHFGDVIHLTGSSINSSRAYFPGDRLKFSLIWQAQRDMLEDYTLTYQLLDSTGRVAAQQDAMAGGGFAATSLWFPGRPVPDVHEMTIPVDTPPGIYRLITYAVHHRNPPERLPVSNPAAPGSDDFAELCSFQIRPRQGQVPPAYKANADFGTVIHSNGFDIPTDAQSPIQISQGTNGTVELSARSNYTLTLKLYWRKVSQPVEKDYTVFVHILDDMGKLVAQQDNPPVNGLYPTSLWETGDVVVDPYQLPLSKLAPGYYSISTGLYSPVTGERLRVSEASGQATDQRELILAHLRIRP